MGIARSAWRHSLHLTLLRSVSLTIGPLVLVLLTLHWLSRCTFRGLVARVLSWWCLQEFRVYFENRAAKAAKFKGKMAAKGKDTYNAFEDDEPESTPAASAAAAAVDEAEEAPGAIEMAKRETQRVRGKE